MTRWHNVLAGNKRCDQGGNSDLKDVDEPVPDDVDLGGAAGNLAGQLQVGKVPNVAVVLGLQEKPWGLKTCSKTARFSYCVYVQGGPTGFYTGN